MNSSGRPSVPNLRFMTNLMKNVVSHNDRMESKKKERFSVSTKDESEKTTEEPNVVYYQDKADVGEKEGKEDELSPELFAKIVDEIGRMRQMTRFHLLKIPGIGANANVLFAYYDRIEEKFGISDVKFSRKKVDVTELNAIIAELAVVKKKINEFSGMIEQYIEEKKELTKVDPESKKNPENALQTKDQAPQIASSLVAGIKNEVDDNMNVVVVKEGESLKRNRIRIRDAVPPRRTLKSMVEKKK